MPTLAELMARLDRWYDPADAESWDAIGLVCGDPAEPVERVLLAVDAVPATVGEALRTGAQLLLTHHPLLLGGVHGVPAGDPKGRMVHSMIRGGVAHFVAHTNADVADPGVSDALAAALGLRELTPLQPQLDAGLLKLVVFVPTEHTDALVDALAAAGAGRLGAYDRCAWVGTGEGTFRPLAGSSPAVGTEGRIERVAESRVEMVVPPARVAGVVSALRAAHPYEEPAFDLLVQAELPGRRGLGRVGTLREPMTLRAFTEHVARALPATQGGVRAAGDPARPVHTVAVCGGSGGELIERAQRAGADAFVTADLKHHRVLEAVTERGPDAMALVDATHWATEAPWLDAVAARLRAEYGTTVDVQVSRQLTDPWTVHAQAPDPAPPAADPTVMPIEDAP